MNPTVTHPAHPLPAGPAPWMAQALFAAARAFARIAVALRRTAATRRRSAHMDDPHVGERIALRGLGAYLLRDIGAPPSLIASATEAANNRVPERLLAGLY